MSDYLRERAAPGDLLDCEGPHGTFYLREGEEPVLMVAGGTVSRRCWRCCAQLAARRAQQPITLCFGVTAAEDLFCVDELAALGKELPGFEVRMAVARGEPGGGHVAGPVTDLLQPGTLRRTGSICAGLRG